MISEYPLAWPDGIPRTARPEPAKFRTSLSAAINNVMGSLMLFGKDTGKAVRDIILSSNVAGLRSKVTDPGVAVWFMWDGEMRCIAVDRYLRVEWNLQAIHHIIEARRVEFRHGGLHIIKQSFRGFTALPGPPKDDEWWTVLGVSRDAPMSEIEASYRRFAKAAHPDVGGTEEMMRRLNRAISAARAERR